MIKALVAPLPVQLPSTVRVAFRPVTALRASDALLLSPPVGLQHWFFLYCHVVTLACHMFAESSANDDKALVFFRRPSSLYQSSVVCPTLACQQLASSCSGLDALSFDLH